MDIDGWLRGINLDQYAEMFRANDIDIELLGRLTNDDLKDIGVASFGHRKKLLEAIAELGSARAPAPAALPAATPVISALIPIHRRTATARRPGRSRGRAALSDGDVLRSGGFDRHFRAARCRGVARPGRRPISTPPRRR